MERYGAEMVEAIGWWAESGIYLEGPGMINVRDVEMKARALRSEFPDRPLVVCADYLQYCHVGDWSMSKSDRISAASMRLASLAKELDAIVITLSQLTNSDSVHPIPVPSKKQVRWSQDILNDADSLLLYHRPWDTDPKMGHHSILTRAKARFLTPAHVRMKADGSRNTFEWSDNPGAMDNVDHINRTPCLNNRRGA
jgi:replicative DNA helicase